MIREVIFPKISTKTADGIITSWNKAIGESINEGEVLYEVETEKAVHEVESPVTGIVKKVLVDLGDEVHVDDVLAEVEVVR
ncbi:biotin/lipoyl-containing protein [uncultured Enterococcus sp.]|uniref:biotin/lipoyl-containing protein n=1 Tax=uncultured Enterococcus sp. TaxID=167972 RepID=UPI0025983EEA|nr:biotin/lipoyl-containing protein [uncultured Enterococcus sp.]